MTPQPHPQAEEHPTDLDHAIRLFKEYLKGNNGFDELDFKEWLIDWREAHASTQRQEGELAGRIAELKAAYLDGELSPAGRAERQYRLDTLQSQHGEKKGE